MINLFNTKISFNKETKMFRIENKEVSLSTPLLKFDDKASGKYVTCFRISSGSIYLSADLIHIFVIWGIKCERKNWKQK